MKIKNLFYASTHEETVKFGKKIGKSLKNGNIVGLIGPLGAGKTTLIKGIACGLGLSDESEVKSPTFIIHNQYHIKNRIFNHIDLYRLSHEAELEDIGFRDMISEHAITVIEWCDRIPSLQNECDILIIIEFDGNQRKITQFR